MAQEMTSLTCLDAQGNEVTFTISDPDAVKCCTQELTEQQKACSRANIGAASTEEMVTHNEAVAANAAAAAQSANNAAASASAAASSASTATSKATAAANSATAAAAAAQEAKANAVVATPVRGTDYWTEADKAEIKGYVDEAILGGAW